MTPIEPAIFAAELIARLEKVKQEQETMNTLEERLQKIKEVRGICPAIPLPMSHLSSLCSNQCRDFSHSSSIRLPSVCLQISIAVIGIASVALF